MRPKKAPIGVMSYDEITSIDDIVVKNPLTIEQIATAQSRICRYGGRGKYFYSDAQHAYLVSLMVPQEKDIVLGALIHDAHEIHIGDCIGPFKRELGVAYKIHEDYIQKLFLKNIGISWPLHESIRLADRAICKYEMEGLNSTGIINLRHVTGLTYGFWSMEYSAERWLDRWEAVSNWMQF